jgi:PKD repeat protein
LTATPESGTAPLTVNFSGSATGGTPPYSYRWTFGDGGSSTAQNPSYVYSSAGTYTATFSATDSVSANVSVTKNIAVVSAADVSLSLSSETGAPAPGQGGTTDPAPGKYSFSIRSEVAAKSIPSADYRFSKWSGDIAESGMFTSGTTITMDKDKSLLATFCTKCGDVNGNLQITPADAQLAFSIYLNKITDPTWCELENADVNCDGTKLSPKVTPADAQMIFSKYLKKDVGSSDCSGNTRIATVSELSSGSATIWLVINNISFVSGEDISVPIIIESPSDIKAFGFDLVFPSDTLTYIGLESAELTKDYDQLGAHVISYQQTDPNKTSARPLENIFPRFVSLSGSKSLASQEADRKDGLRDIGRSEKEPTNLKVLRVGGYKTRLSVNPASGVLVTLIFRVIEDVKDSNPLSVIATYDDIKNAKVRNETIASPHKSKARENQRTRKNVDNKLPGNKYDF